ncbi:MAG: adenylyltransferase/cytidyltransferase family protein [Acidimicrobiales bacterium]|nr:adenylyltransferase/cytidyltransferase family protein [Acidimicrobiales bacterium]RZV48644.1 MAG: glycerol-3-phosphate cytidylyltransferase [Acidimicrobiales bacterium]
MTKPTGVIVSGYFSPLHAGHLDMMEDAATRGDTLIVIVNNNAQQEMKKGKVIVDESDRLRIVNAMRIVDHAFIAIDEDRTVSASLEKIAGEFPDHHLVFANGGDRSTGEVVPESAVCERFGIDMVFDMGGTEKADSSSRINVELGLEDEMSAPPSATT